MNKAKQCTHRSGYFCTLQFNCDTTVPYYYTNLYLTVQYHTAEFRNVAEKYEKITFREPLEYFSVYFLIAQCLALQHVKE